MDDFNKYHFTGQKEGEKILLVAHRHWFDILTQFLFVLLLLGMLIGGYLYMPLIFPFLQKEIGDAFFAFMANTFLLFVWIIFFIIWIDYYFDVWIVTNQRIVNIDQRGLFSREVSELELENIQDVTTEVSGIIPTFFNYGDLYIQTASEKERFLFHNVPDPYAIKDLIMNLQEDVEKMEENQFGEMLREKVRHREV